VVAAAALALMALQAGILWWGMRLASALAVERRTQLALVGALAAALALFDLTHLLL
jgi:hypothetical protein